MTPDEEKRRIAAERKRAYRQRKRSEELARQANPEELSTMFNLQAHNIAPELEEKWRNAESDSRIYPMPDSDGKALPPNMPYQGKKGYHDIVHEALVQAVDSATPNFRKPPESVSFDDHREQAQAIVSDAEERHRRVELIMANYKKEAANGNALLWHILETLTLMRLEMVDLLGGLKCGTK